MGRGVAVVLFTDLVGSTELRGRLGEEAADELLRKHDQLLAQAVEGNNGQVIKSLGDGVMATFSGASDGVAAAVAIQQAVDRLNRSGNAPVPLSVRVGLAAGDVGFEDDDVHGTPVIEAARLCAAAGGDEILTADVVRILAGSTGGHEYVLVGPLELKGLDHPVIAVRVRWEPAAVSSVPMPALLTDVGRIFVGRDAEVERLRQLWKQAAAGERQVALLAGEPGVGKTRLAAELAIGVHEEGGIVLAGRCDEDLGVPYQPFVEALRHFVDHTPAKDLPDRLGRYGGELARLVPELDAFPLPPPMRSDPQTEQYRLFDALAAWLGAVSAEAPVLFLLDDLQWAAKPTLLLLRHVVRSADTMRVLFLGTYRDTEVGHDHPLREVLVDLRRQRDIERLSLMGLDSSAVVAFVEQAADRRLDEDDILLARAVYAETEGNPFFVREVLRHLVETGGLERREGRWTVPLPVDELGIPESVRDVVGRRLARLSPEANQALRVAAVAGAEFELSVVQAASGLTAEVLLSAIEEATQARLTVETTAADRYRFAHALVRDTLYEELSAARRVAVHHRVAEGLEAVHASDLSAYLPALAHHWARATAPVSDPTRAVDYAARAGDRARAQLAHDEAVSYYRQALELIGDRSDCPRRLELVIALGESQRDAGDPDHRGTLLEAARLAQACDDHSALARAALANSRGFLMSVVGQIDGDKIRVLEAALASAADDDCIRARLLGNLAMELMYSPDFERRASVSAEALRLARRADDPVTLAHVMIGRFQAVAAPHTVIERLALTAELVELAQRIGDPALISRAWFVRYRVAIEAADISEADRAIGIFVEQAEALGQPFLRWVVVWMKAGRRLLAGDVAGADTGLHAMHELGQASGQPDATTWFVLPLCLVRLEQGRLGELENAILDLMERLPALLALRALLALIYCELHRSDDARAVLEPLVRSGFDLPLDVMWGHSAAYLATASVELHEPTWAATLRRRLVPYADHVALPAGGVTPGAFAHYIGVLATVEHDYDEAETSFRRAADIHTRMSAPILLARTRLEWARMLLARRQAGDADRARELLGQALATARDVGLAKVERDAVALLR